jgi:hypothetical protein
LLTKTGVTGLADVTAEVLAIVERALRKDPSLRSKELQKEVAKSHRSVASLSARQFHARFALQAKKRLAGAGKPGPKKKAAKRSKARSKGRARTSASTASATVSATPLKRSDPVRALLRERFEERQATLARLMDQAFKRSMDADSLTAVNTLLESVEKQIGELQSS